MVSGDIYFAVSPVQTLHLKILLLEMLLVTVSRLQLMALVKMRLIEIQQI
jgi:hypothetical protein